MTEKITMSARSTKGRGFNVFWFIGFLAAAAGVLFGVSEVVGLVAAGSTMTEDQSTLIVGSGAVVLVILTLTFTKGGGLGFLLKMSGLSALVGGLLWAAHSGFFN